MILCYISSMFMNALYYRVVDRVTCHTTNGSSCRIFLSRNWNVDPAFLNTGAWVWHQDENSDVTEYRGHWYSVLWDKFKQLIYGVKCVQNVEINVDFFFARSLVWWTHNWYLEHCAKAGTSVPFVTHIMENAEWVSGIHDCLSVTYY